MDSKKTKSKENSAVTNFLPDREIRDPNSSALVAVFYVLRRQPWKILAIRVWDTMKQMLQAALLAALLGALVQPASAQARTYDVITADVPFKFNIGNRTFRPGQYQFIMVGNGLLALRDAKAHVIDSLTTRSIEIGEPAPTSKLVFDTKTKHARLAQIWLSGSSQVVEILGEEYTVRKPSSPPPAIPWDVNIDSLFDRRTAPGLKP
jgi:hypothetical protein